MRRRKATNGGMKPFGISKGGDDLHLEEGSLSAGIDRTAASVLPPQWVDDVDAVHQELADITRLLGVLQSMHSSRVGSVFGKDLDEVEGKIEKLTQDITDRFRTAERYLQRVGTATRRAGGEEALVGTNVQRSLAKKLQEMSVEFRQMQRKYLADVQAQKSGGAEGREAKFGLMDEENGHGDGEFGFTMQQQAVVDDLQAAVQSRDKEIVGIAKSIEELGAIFKELAVLVIDQGTILDRIDYNMEAVVEHTKTGIQQLEKAEASQKNARPLKCIIFLVCLIAFLLLILVIKHRRRRGIF